MFAKYSEEARFFYAEKEMITDIIYQIPYKFFSEYFKP